MSKLDGYDEYFDDEFDDAERDFSDEDEWECQFPERCLMPSVDHRRDECFDLEMAEAMHHEMSKAAK